MAKYIVTVIVKTIGPVLEDELYNTFACMISMALDVHREMEDEFPVLKSVEDVFIEGVKRA